MASGESKRLVDVPLANSIATTDTIIVVANGAISQSNTTTIFANINVHVGTVVFSNTATPLSSTANVVQGTLWFDSNYVYVAVANNVIKRSALSSF